MAVVNRPGEKTTDRKVSRPQTTPPFDGNDNSNNGDNGGNGGGGNNDNNDNNDNNHHQPRRGFERPKRPLGWLIAGRAAFVICGAMFIVMVLGSIVSIIITTAEPTIAPSVPDTRLRQDKIYIKYDDETIFHELVITQQSVSPEPIEVTQIAQNRPFQLIFTPKQMGLPEEYKAYYRSGDKKGQSITVNFERKAKYNNTGDENFYIVTVRPNASENWPLGEFEINMPAPGMFGGQYYSYVTVNGK